MGNDISVVWQTFSLLCIEGFSCASYCCNIVGCNFCALGRSCSLSGSNRVLKDKRAVAKLLICVFLHTGSCPVLDSHVLLWLKGFGGNVGNSTRHARRDLHYLSRHHSAQVEPEAALLLCMDAQALCTRACA